MNTTKTELLEERKAEAVKARYEALEKAYDEAEEAKRGAWVALSKALKTKGVSGDEEWDTYEKTWEAYQSICREIEEEGK